MAVFAKAGKWWIDYYVDGYRRRECVGTSKAQAKRALDARRGEIAQGRFNLKKGMGKTSLRDFRADYMAWARTNKRSWVRDGQLTSNLCKRLGGKTLARITSWDIEKYKRERSKECSVATVNREVACLKHMYNLAIEWGKAEKNPVRGVKLFKENNRREVILTEEECHRLVGNSPDFLRPVVVTALNTVMRIGEILALRVADVDFDNSAIHVRDSKSGEGRRVPMNSCLTETLGTVILGKKHDDKLFLNRNGKPYRDVSQAFKTALAKSGLKCRVHDLRHTFASHMVMSGVDIVTLKEILGHKTIEMTMRYSHLSATHKKDAVEKLGDAFSGKDSHLLDTRRFSGLTEKVVSVAS